MTARVQTVIEKFFNQSQHTLFPFLLVHGPMYTGKTAMLEQAIAEVMGNYIQQDYRALYDLSFITGKNHTFKIEVDEEEQIMSVEGKKYYDLGARDVSRWLAVAPMGKIKIVFIEHIERMSHSAANALLKTFEEPLPGRIIVATTTHKWRLLDTILSRAWLVDMPVVADATLVSQLQQAFPGLSAELQHFIVTFASWRPRLAREMAQRAPEKLATMAMHFHQLTQSTKQTLSGSLEHISAFLWSDQRDRLCLARAHVALDRQDMTQVQALLNARKMTRTNVQKSHVVFDVALQTIER